MKFARAVACVIALVVAACNKQGATPAVLSHHSPLADSADQVMWGARSIITDRGLLRAELLSDTAYFFDDNTRIELQVVHTTFYTTTGEKDAVLTSKEGTYNTRRGYMEARKNVLIVATDGRRLTTEQLRFDQNRNEITSDSAFVMTQGDRRLTGVGFVSDPNMNNIKCLNACGGVGAFTLPSP
jgi:LPS export ABC transporter protein LptC